ncbi:uncharacterized protein BJX67DRAFT_315285 [Aspergillus lucknowensis]|uniref:Uncharacterized protein n=1 Tax=Aspergillus lucknowensis TaxID=176173 RepID=A0ABR4L9F6_9EURO
MQRAIEQAGSVFTGWVSSCLLFLDSSGDDGSAHRQQALKQKGGEREMQICHSQPHLVPPMKLVVYDELPSPGPPRASSFPTWVMEESRNLASRASSRASMSFRRKSTAPVRISAPTDFRRVTTLPNISTGFRPLELNFESPANRLPDLPSFSEYGAQENEQAPLVRPPRALSFMTDFSYQTRPRTHRPSSSFHLPRKPVGSGSRRSSLATVELLMEKQVPISHPLIPHFSTRVSTASVATGLATGTFTSPPTRPDPIVDNNPSVPENDPPRESHDAAASTAPRIPQPTTTPGHSLPPIPIKNLPSSGRFSYELPATPVNTQPIEPSPNPSPYRSSRVAQWLLQTTSANTHAKSPSGSPPHPRKPSFSDKVSMRIRSRTLSGSTIAPSINNPSTPGGFKAPTSTTTTTTPPLSHTTTAATTKTARTPTLDSQTEKDLEIPGRFPYPPKQTQSTIPSNEHGRAHPTIHESQPQPQHGYNYNYNSSYYNHTQHQNSAIGVAF